MCYTEIVCTTVVSSQCACNLTGCCLTAYYVITVQNQQCNANVIFIQSNSSWNELEAPDSQLYPWDPKSTYIKSPPFFDGMVCIYTVTAVHIIYTIPS